MEHLPSRFRWTLGALAAVAGLLTAGGCSDRPPDTAKGASIANAAPISADPSSDAGASEPVAASFGLLSFDAVAHRDGIIEIEFYDIDVESDISEVGLVHHYCDATVRDVLVGDLTAGERIRIACYSTAAPGTSTAREAPEMLELMTTVSTRRPQVGDVVVVAPSRRPDDTRLGAVELTYDPDAGTVAITDVLRFQTQVPATDTSVEGLEPAPAVDTAANPTVMSVAEFAQLWQNSPRLADLAG